VSTLSPVPRGAQGVARLDEQPNPECVTPANPGVVNEQRGEGDGGSVGAGCAGKKTLVSTRTVEHGRRHADCVNEV
jgi:hypothetical protein